MTYFSDNEPYVVEWVQNLHPEATVDPRSIVDVQSVDVAGHERVHFFAGIGGWDYALDLAGWEGPVWTGSCPCQPFSAAGKRKGTQDERHLWPEMLRLIRECRPPTIFGEQVASKLGRAWLAGIRTDLEALGYAVGAADLCAAGVGAPHIRQRLYWVAHTPCVGHEWSGRAWHGRQGPTDCGNVSDDLRHGSGGVGDTDHARPQGRVERGDGTNQRTSGQTGLGFWSDFGIIPCADGKQRRIEPGTSPLAHGVPARVGKLRAYGNAIVPQVAAAFVKAYREARLNESASEHETCEG